MLSRIEPTIYEVVGNCGGSPILNMALSSLLSFSRRRDPDVPVIGMASGTAARSLRWLHRNDMIKAILQQNHYINCLMQRTD